MGIPSFFKQNKPRGFNYRPRYYDPVREEWEQRRRAQSAGQATKDEQQEEGKTEKGSPDQPYRSKIMRGDMKNYFPRREDRMQKHSVIRLIVIILILFIVIYIYLRF